MITVYVVTCVITGKCYVGCTQQPLKKRWSMHRYLAGKGNSPNAFHQAIRTLGAHAFRITARQEFERREDADAAEQVLIKRLKTAVPGGYNMTAGGRGGDWWKGKKLAPAHAAAVAKGGLKNKGKKRTGQDTVKGRLRRRLEAAKRKAPASGMVGVYPDRHKWSARISRDGKKVRLGSYLTKEEAKAVYDAAAAEHLEFLKSQIG